MKKLLFITRALDVGGVENALFDLTILLSRDGYDCTVFSVLKDGEWIERFKKAGIKVVNAWSPEPSADGFFSKAIRWIHRRRVDASFKKNGSGLLKLGGINPSDFDLTVVYHQGKWCPLAGIETHGPAILYVHGDISNFTQLAANLSPLLDRADRFSSVICVSDVAKAALLESHPELASKAVSLLNPIDADRIKALAQLPFNAVAPDERFICAVGRLSPEKGFERLVRIHRRLLDKGIVHKLVIVGNGPQRESIEQTIKDTETESSVILTGSTDNPYSVISQAAVTVISSFHEGLPVVSMESLILGIPVISSAPSVSEAFGNYPCGLITDTDDASLEAGIERMLTEAAFYESAKSAAAERGKELDGVRMVKTVETVYENVIENR